MATMVGGHDTNDVRAAPSSPTQGAAPPLPTVRRLNALAAKGWRIDPRTDEADLRLRHPQFRRALYMTGEGALLGAEADGATCVIAADDEAGFRAFVGRTPRINPLRRFIFAHGAPTLLLGFFVTALAVFSIIYDALD